MGTTVFVWDPVFDCVTHELDENNNVKAEYHNEPQPYGGVLSQRRGTTTHYHHHDALGSTRFLTDSSGNVTDTYLHDAWGNLVASTGTTINPFKWVGKYGYYTDNSTAQVYVRARMYQPTVARWMNLDPAGLIDGPNRYVYVTNVVTQMVDPSGSIAIEIRAGSDGGCCGPCGQFARAFDFKIENGDRNWARKHCNPNADGTITAYIVQRILREGKCTSDCCDSNWKLPTLPTVDEFWEAFLISDVLTVEKPNDPQPGISDSVGFTDLWGQGDMGTSKGKTQVTGFVRLYCKDGKTRSTGDLNAGAEGFTACTKDQVVQQNKANTCDFSKPQCPSGQLPFTRQKPSFWHFKIDALPFGWPSAVNKATVTWDCCTESKDCDCTFARFDAGAQGKCK